MLELQSVTYEIDARVILDDVSASFGVGTYGLVGANGAGKTTLARLLAGDAQPTSGRVLRQGAVAYMAQQERRPPGRVDDVLEEVWTAGPVHAALAASLLQSLEPGRPLAALSGGEWIRLRLARALSSSPDFLILDEPTNDLDLDGREAVLRLVREFEGGLLVISHDRELLGEVDEILELKPSGLARYRGGFEGFWQQRTAARERQRDDLQRARREQRAAVRERQAKLERQEHRMRAGARRAAKGGVPPILAGGMKRRAQGTAGKLKAQADSAVEAASDELDGALEALETDPFMRLDFEAEAPPPSRQFFEARDLNLRFDGADGDLWPVGVSFLMSGRERWHLKGGNGAGKSTLLRLLMQERRGTASGTETPFSGGSGGVPRLSTQASLWTSGRPLVYLDQSLSLLRDSDSVLENTGEASRFGTSALRNELAFYGFTGDRVHQRVGTLSGGERLRAALARCFLGAAIPQVILLDEPTNNLDFQSQELLESALSRFRGLLVVVSHDIAFVRQLDVTHELTLPRVP